MLLRAFAIALILLTPLAGARIKLYLQGGGDLLVSEYSVEGDRIRYYSVERGAWEEIPTDLVDLKRTQSEHERKEAALGVRREQERLLQEAERKARVELHSVPLEDGVYHVNGDEIAPVQQAELIVDNSATATILRVLSPLPAADETTLKVAGPRSALVVNQDQPAFYMRLEKMSRIEIFRLKKKKKFRHVQVIQKVSKTQQIFETQELVEIFRQQLAPQVYKLWPVDSLPAGEYAVVEYTPEEENIRVWDFSVPAATEG